MKAVMYRGIGQVAVEEIEKPVMNADDYLVKVEYAGLCGMYRSICRFRRKR